LGWNIKSSPDASRVDRGAVLFSVAGQSTTITTALQGGACGITSAPAVGDRAFKKNA
jgi:phosphosulfolactate phosphohydrolase-like enzyme